MRDLSGKRITYSKIEILLMFLFFVMCGFPNGVLIPYKTLIIAIMSLPQLRKKKNIGMKPLLLFLSSFILVYFLQKHFLGVADGRTPQIIIAGWCVCTVLDKKFRYAFLQGIYLLSLISIPCYLSMRVLEIIPDIDILANDNYEGFFLWNVRLNEIVRGRNCGSFWEPGAYAGYICIVLILFFDKLNVMWKLYKKQMIVIHIALITTFSTQGYVIAFFIYIFYYLRENINPVRLAFIAIFLFIGYIISLNVNFLSEKITEQLVESKDIHSKEGSLSLSRFSTTMMDIYYIKKRPITGNTSTPSIRYSDHPHVISSVEYLNGWGTGSGITDFIAQYGIIPFLIWLYFTAKAFEKGFNRKSMFLCVLLILMLGNAECYFLWIMYNSFPFVKY